MSLVHETDFGTPLAKSEKMIALTIDGQVIEVPEGTSIMRAAMEMGTQIPKPVSYTHLDVYKRQGFALARGVEIDIHRFTVFRFEIGAEHVIVAKGQHHRMIFRGHKSAHVTAFEIHIEVIALDQLAINVLEHGRLHGGFFGGRDRTGKGCARDKSGGNT